MFCCRSVFLFLDLVLFFSVLIFILAGSGGECGGCAQDRMPTVLPVPLDRGHGACLGHMIWSCRHWDVGLGVCDLDLQENPSHGPDGKSPYMTTVGHHQ